MGSSSSSTSGRLQQERGQPEQHRLAAGHLADGAVQPDVAETELAERRERALLDVPVVADGLEVFRGRVARLDGVQRGAGGGDTEHLVDPEAGVERDVLREVPDLARDTHRAVGRGEFPAISFNRVVFPDPLTPTSPVLPGPKAIRRSSKTVEPSGQEKESEVQVMDTDMGPRGCLRGSRATRGRHRGAAADRRER